MKQKLLITFGLAIIFLIQSIQFSHAVTIREQIKQEQEKIRTTVASKVAERRDQVSTRAVIVSGIVSDVGNSSFSITKEGKTYAVNYGAATQIRRKYWGKSDLAEFSSGDTVNVIGKFTDEAHTTISALLIRNLSIQKRHGVFFGTVISVSDTGFVIEAIRRGSQAVTVNSSTQYINRRESTISLNDIKVGHKVRVRGLWDSNAKAITEVTKVKDFSLPVVPRPSTTNQ